MSSMRVAPRFRFQPSAFSLRPTAYFAAMVLCLIELAVARTTIAETVVLDFESVPLTSENEFGRYYDGADGAGGFVQHGVRFDNSFEDFGTYAVWSGWSASDSHDSVASGFQNQFSVWAGGGAQRTAVGGPSAIVGGGQFGVAFVSDQQSARIEFPRAARVLGMHITNTTYAALSMQQGDSFAKKFGGPDGDDPDFLELTIHGWDASGRATGSVPLPLADFRSPQSSDDYILDNWQWVDLASLGDRVRSLSFTFSSSDVGQFGINTPTYFAADNLAFEFVPEPAWQGWWLLALAAMPLAARRRKRDEVLVKQ